jgi:hypothetical protein
MFRKSPGFAVAALVGTLACATTSAQSTTRPSPPDQSTSSPAQTGPEPVNAAEPGTLPSGQELDVRLQDALSSETATVEQRFEATTVVDLTQDGDVLVPAGSVVRGIVRAVEPATRTNRTGKLTLAFDRIEVRGTPVTIRGNAVEVFKSDGLAGEAVKIGAGAGVGGLIGGILGGTKGAIIGVLVGAGGTVAATEGKDVDLPAGSIVRLRLDSPARVATRR